jgi:autotransporter-associated beta strand protein
MSVSSWWRFRTTRAGRTPNRTARPRLEALEDRLLMAANPFIWTGASPNSSSWSDPRNWQGNVAPGNDADLVFPAVAARKTGETVGTLTRAHSITYQGSGYSVLDSTQIGNTIVIGVAFEADNIIATNGAGTNTFGPDLVLPLFPVPLNNTAGAAVNVSNAGATLQLTGTLTGPGVFLKQGLGEVQLGGNSHNTGPVIVQAGTLTVENSNALGSATGTVEVDAGATLFLNANFGLAIGAKPLSLAGTLRAAGTVSYAGNISLVGTSVIEVDNGPGAQLGSLTLSGTVSSSYSSFPEALTKEGAGTLVLAHANTYGGGTNVDAGGLSVTDPAGLGVSTFIPFATQTGVVVKAGAALEVDTDATINQPLTLEGNTGPGATPAVLAVGPGHSVTWVGAGFLDDVFLQGNAELDAFGFGGFGGFGGGPGGHLTVTAGITGTGDLTVGGGGIVELAGTQSNTYKGTTVVRGGTLELGKSSAFIPGPAPIAVPGNLVIQDGTVTLLDQTVLGIPVPGTGSGQIAATAAVTITDGTLNLNGNSNTVASLTLVGGSVTTGGGTLTLNGDVSASADAGGTVSTISGNLSLGNASRTFHVLVNGKSTTGLSIPAVISGGTFIGFTKDGAATLDLSGANTYSGLTEVKAGALRIENGSALGVGFAPGTAHSPPPAANAFRLTQVDGGASLELAGTAAYNVNEQLTLEPGATLANVDGFSRSWLAPVSLVGLATVSNSGNGTFEIDGPTDGAGSLDKAGTGNVRLTANNSYGGTTLIDRGTLFVDGDQHTIPVAVHAGGTLAGQGSVGAVTVGPGGALAPGLSVGSALGTLHAAGNVSLATGSTYTVQLENLKFGPVHSELDVTGTVSLGNATLDLIERSGFLGTPPNISFPIIHSTGGVIGTFGNTTISVLEPGGSGNVDTFVVTTTPTDVKLTFKGTTIGALAKFVDRSISTPVSDGHTATLTGTIVDPDVHGTFVLRVDWGDGTPAQTFTYPPSAPRRVRLRHRYSGAGHYTVRLLWQDRNGAPNSAALDVVVTPR